MSASSPTTRTVPSATAVVNGDIFGAKKRMYGSSDVSENRSVNSASISGVRARRPDPDTDRRLDEASKSIVSIWPRSDRCPWTWPMPSSAGEQVGDADRDVVAGHPRTCRCRWRRTRRMPESGARGNEIDRQRLDRDLRAVGVERVVAVPGDPRRAGDRAGALPDVDLVEADAGALEPETRRRDRRTARRRPCPCRSAGGRRRAGPRYWP